MEIAAAQFADVGGRRLAYAPANKTLRLLLNGALARRGVRQARTDAR
jgi:hypothetical protein